MVQEPKTCQMLRILVGRVQCLHLLNTGTVVRYLLLCIGIGIHIRMIRWIPIILQVLHSYPLVSIQHRAAFKAVSAVSQVYPQAKCQIRMCNVTMNK